MKKIGSLTQFVLWVAAALFAIVPMSQAGQTCADLNGNGVYDEGECIEWGELSPSQKASPMSLKRESSQSSVSLEALMGEVSKAQEGVRQAQSKASAALKRAASENDPTEKAEAIREAQGSQVEAQKAQLMAAVAQMKAQSEIQRTLGEFSSQPNQPRKEATTSPSTTPAKTQGR